jgi:ankyrin repeat protein
MDDRMGDLEKLMEAAQHGSVEDVRAIVQSHGGAINPGFINRKDETGATALHYAAFGGRSDVVRVLVELGAEINAIDSRFGATPAGWAIEYMREMGGLLGIELSDFAYAIGRGDVEWVARFLKRFPALRNASDQQGVPFKQLAQQSGNPEIMKLFESEAAG